MRYFIILIALMSFSILYAEEEIFPDCWDYEDIPCENFTISATAYECPTDPTVDCQYNVEFCIRVVKDEFGNILYRDVFISNYTILHRNSDLYPPPNYTGGDCPCYYYDIGSFLLKLIWNDEEVIEKFEINNITPKYFEVPNCRVFVAPCYRDIWVTMGGIPYKISTRECDDNSCCRYIYSVGYSHACSSDPCKYRVEYMSLKGDEDMTDCTLPCYSKCGIFKITDNPLNPFPPIE